MEHEFILLLIAIT